MSIFEFALEAFCSRWRGEECIHLLDVYVVVYTLYNGIVSGVKGEDERMKG